VNGNGLERFTSAAEVEAPAAEEEEAEPNLLATASLKVPIVRLLHATVPDTAHIPTTTKNT